MDSIRELSAELRKCDQLGSSWNGWCKEQVRKRWLQNLIGPRVYPWVNAEWSYRQFVKNNYDPTKLGLDYGEGFSALMKNIDILIKQVNSLLVDPNPNDSSVAGRSDQPYTNNRYASRYERLYREIAELKKDPVANKYQLQALQSTIKYLEDNRLVTAKELGLAVNSVAAEQKAPYSDPFFNRPKRGRGSSSYYVQTGFCKTKDNEQNCKSKGMNWIGDTCYKGKYMYLDNAPGLKVGYIKDMNGLIPSLINDVTQLNPKAFAGLLQGYGVPGAEIQMCDEDLEHFQSRDSFQSGDKKQQSMTHLLVILLGLCVIFVILFMYR